MKIVLVTHGTIPVPPPAWGAVENLAWNTTQRLRQLGHEVRVVNTRNRRMIVEECNAFQADVVHVHCEDYVELLPQITARLKVATPHNSLTAFHGRQMAAFVQGDFVIVTLSPRAADCYLRNGVPASRICVIPNGTDGEQFAFHPECKFPERSIYLAQITPNKRQHVYQSLTDLDFVGRISSKLFKPGPTHLGEWSRARVHAELTDYANLVLLSENEMHPCVTGEAMVCGLGVVVSPVAAANLDPTQPFITVVPEPRLFDLDYVRAAIVANREAAIPNRAAIRAYALEQFSCDRQVQQLLQTYERYLPRKRRPLPVFEF